MKAKLLLVSLVGLTLLAVGFVGQSVLQSGKIELWYLHHSYLVSDEEVAKSKALIDKAVAAGYTGAIFWDSTLNFMGNSDWDPANERRMRQVMAYAHEKHLKTLAELAPYGWSNDVLTLNPNWAETQRVAGTRFRVTPDGRSLQLVDTQALLVNGNFHSNKDAWFALNDPNIAVIPNAYQGASVLTITDPPGNARVKQEFAVKPWHQYHLGFAYKTSGSNVGGVMVNVIDSPGMEKTRLNSYPHSPDKWSYLEYSFNSGDSTQLVLYMGVWGGAKGTIQFAGVGIEETGLVYVAHREGAPFKLYDPDNPSKVYTPQVDYNEVVDPDMEPSRYAFHNSFHNPPPFTLPSTTQLKPGQIVAADYYAVFPMAQNNQVSMCMTEPAVFQWLARNAMEVRKYAPADLGVLLAYDEMRQGNSCASCRAKNMTAGELLGWNFDETFGIYRQTMPDSSFWVWNDMFDPYHNAHDHMMYVEGSFAGSWKGLPPEVSILNWNLGHLKDSLSWFSGNNPDQPVPHRQMIAGYYDKGDAAAEAQREIIEAHGVPAVQGLMYTTWEDNYSNLHVFADAARAAWPEYLRSVQK